MENISVTRLFIEVSYTVQLPLIAFDKSYFLVNVFNGVLIG